MDDKPAKIHVPTDYPGRFEEVAARAFRAYLVHYDEAHHFDRMVLFMEATAALFLIPACYFGYRTKWLQSVSSVAGSVMLEYSARGNDIKYLPFPSLADRSQNHVDAAAHFRRIYNEALLYSQEARFGKNEDKNFERYMTLLGDREEASRKSVVRGSVYDKYNDDPELVKKKFYKSYLQVKTFRDMLRQVEPEMPNQEPPTSPPQQADPKSPEGTSDESGRSEL